MMKRALFALVVAGTLTGCQQNPTYVAVGPPLVVYSDRFLDKAADEMKAVQACCPNTTQLIIDYAKLRAAVKVITKQDTRPKSLTDPAPYVKGDGSNGDSDNGPANTGQSP